MECVSAMVLLQILLLLAHGISISGGVSHVNDSVLDLLAVLNLSQPLSGVSRVQTSSGTLYKLRSRTPHLTVPPESARHFLSNTSRRLSLLLIGQQTSESPATLLSLSTPVSHPLLEITSSPGALRVQHRTAGGALSDLAFPGRNPLAGPGLVRLEVSVEPDGVTFSVGCEGREEVRVASEERIDLASAGDATLTLGSSPGRRDSKFTGFLRAAELSRSMFQRRWDCADIDDSKQDQQQRDQQQREQQHRDQQQRDQQQRDQQHRDQQQRDQQQRDQQKRDQQHRDQQHRDQQQRDQQQRDQQHRDQQQRRAVVLGPPSPPHGTKTTPTQSQTQDQMKRVELRLDQLTLMVDMLKAQNAELQARVQVLEACECVRPRCLWEGRELEEGQTWQTDHALCTCSSGTVRCTARVKGCVHDGSEFDHGAKWRSTLTPCDICSCSDGRVRCDQEPCHTPCKNPAKPPPSSCCPVCQGCGVNGVDFPNGAMILTGDRCQECTCLNGDVRCSPLLCPALSCPNPVHRTGDCCPSCAQCDHEAQIYTDGQRFNSSRDPCVQCLCSAGQVSCEHIASQCPPLRCSHPAPPEGECCPTCRDCEYESRLFPHGKVFTPTGSGPCLHCTCENGNVICRQEKCPPPSCPNPISDPLHCCPVCKGCVLDGVEYTEGSQWRPDSCSSCSCVDGETVCTKTRCSPTDCPHPTRTSGECCPVCDSCTYNHRFYGDGQTFTPPEHPCQTCLCLRGTVTCETRVCSPVPCTTPSTPPGECCPKCPGCPFEGRVFVEGEVFVNPVNPCEECQCSDGRTECLRSHCPAPLCNAPLSGQCCNNNCHGCSFAGREYSNGQQFPHPTDRCRSCSCTNGNVQCLKTRCPPLHCAAPTLRAGECCPQCPAPPSGCTFERRRFTHTERFYHPADSCQSCVCTNGTVQCLHKPCPPGPCSHPITRDCCQSCEGCLFKGTEHSDGAEFPDVSDPCGVCRCFRGDVVCSRTRCLEACSHPHRAPGQCCARCDWCSFRGEVLRDGQSVPDREDPCSRCLCQSGSVRCEREACAPAHCPHPTPDSCGCPVCQGCLFQGAVLGDGQTASGAEGECQECTCRGGAVVCSPVSCPTVTCRRPLTPVGQCCPVCTGVCVHDGTEHPHDSTFTAASDPCSTCSCQNGEVSCQKRPCPVQCSHPVPSQSCCPDCNSCLFEGVVHAQGGIFTPSDPCQRCTCLRGSVACSPLACPQLSCLHQLTLPGACCPQCRGCVYGGEEHPEGSSWFADSAPCLTCMCVDGVTTCSEVRCLSPCHNVISVPGECCPACADCIFEDRLYGPNESFHPADDPCQICTCEVMPDGEQHLRCYRKQCPSLVDCPKSNIIFSGPDSCCPVCAQPLSNCTSALIGNQVSATDDPCFTCHCQDLTWTCLHQLCPALTCPQSEQIIADDACCPVCRDCVIEGQDRRVSNGSRWTDSDDDCVTCSCNLGFIECVIEECEAVVCPGRLRPAKVPGKCCPVCPDSGEPCLFQGIPYGWAERWDVDECTRCTCVFGEVHCLTERCPGLSCATDEMPAVLPGTCCPHCIPRPATCIAFGDPHYRTFDGRMLHFQGACTYVLAQDCEGGDFSVHTTNDERGRKGVSWTKEVTVFIGNVSVQLLQDWVVKVNEEPVTLPFLLEPFVYVERQTRTILLNTNIGLKVLWNGRSHLEVSVPGTYKSQTCGLCGNFNNYYQDDLKMPSGRISASESEFGNSWRVTKGRHARTSCSPGEDVDPCKDAGFQAKKLANARCKVLKSSVFKACHRVVPPEPWYGACVFDLCACGANADECLCDALEAYASQCREAGLVVQWRSPALCAVGCPVERGFVFDECGPLCPVTCFNKDVPLGAIESHCFKPCVPGCQCPAGLVLHNNYCIHPDKCPKVVHDEDRSVQDRDRDRRDIQVQDRPVQDRDREVQDRDRDRRDIQVKDRPVQDRDREVQDRDREVQVRDRDRRDIQVQDRPVQDRDREVQDRDRDRRDIQVKDRPVQDRDREVQDRDREVQVQDRDRRDIQVQDRPVQDRDREVQDQDQTIGTSRIGTET